MIEQDIETIAERISEINARITESERAMTKWIETYMTTALGELQAAVGHLEHSQDRRRLNAKQNAKGDWQLDATVELFGSDNHIVAQELARLVDEGRREMRAEVEEPAAV